jgi:hypothetical protein
MAPNVGLNPSSGEIIPKLGFRCIFGHTQNLAAHNIKINLFIDKNQAIRLALNDNFTRFKRLNPWF